MTAAATIGVTGDATNALVRSGAGVRYTIFRAVVVAEGRAAICGVAGGRGEADGTSVGMKDAFGVVDGEALGRMAGVAVAGGGDGNGAVVRAG
ncbi:MAG: hypothetical protein JO302_03510 [Candidatus Eremiobacteraeota bacterium]|nr:hypothetical protein [Candidatus Eremiobacteraeota bacterium]